MNVTIGEIAQALAGQGGAIVCLLLVILTGVRGIWVWGRELDDANARITRLEDELAAERRASSAVGQAALKAVLAAEHASTLSQTVVTDLSKSVGKEVG